MPATNQLLQEGRYRINHQFASSGQGTVYDAYDTVRNTNVLVKEIVVRLNRVLTSSQQEQLKTTFANQAKLLTEIKHDSLLHVHDFFSEIGRQYLVMEALDGQELSDLLSQPNNRFELSEVLAWADQLLDGLHYLHKFNPPIIHKNIRPNHIKLTAEGRIKLLAFGLADGSDTKISTNITADTQKDEISYSPLEQIWEDLDPASQKVITNSYDERSARSLHEPLDSRSDIYSFGATVYHLLTGRKPVDALERSIEMLEGNHDPLTSPHELRAAIPPEVSDVIMKSMEVKREDRFDSAAILRQILRTAMIRAKERETLEDAKEEREALEAIKAAGETRNLTGRNPLEQKKKEAEAEEARRAAILEQRLREAEEQRLLAEQRAAEAEKLLREKEARAAEAAASAAAASTNDFELDILELPQPLAAAAAPDESVHSHLEIPIPLEKPATKPVIPAIPDKVAFEATRSDVESTSFSDSQIESYSDGPMEEVLIETAAEPESESSAIAADPHAPEVESVSFETETFDVVEEEVRSESSQAPSSEAVQVAATTATPEPADDESYLFEEPEPTVETHDEEVAAAAFDPHLQMQPETAVGNSVYAHDHSEAEYFSYDEPAGRYSGSFSLPMPVIAGVAAAVLVMVGLGGYLMLSGSAEPENDVPAEIIKQLEASQPQQVTTPIEQPAAEPVTSTPTITDDITTQQQLVEEAAPTRKAAQPTPPRSKKPVQDPAAKPATPKKAVTVDDLIRDN